MSNNFSFLQTIKDELTNKGSLKTTRASTFYPSEASAEVNGEVIGSCLRKSFYRLQQDGSMKGSTKPSSAWAAEMGKLMENISIDKAKRSGIFLGNNIKFYDPKTNISGELDILVEDPDGNKVIVEQKSYSGYMGKKLICGNKSTKGKPRDSHLMQLQLYLGHFAKQVPYGFLVYFARDSAEHAEFHVKLTKKDGKTWASVNGEIDDRVYLEAIYERYAKLLVSYKKKILPTRDFYLEYPDHIVEKKWAQGAISKTAYTNWQKNPAKNPVGDWQCSYCEYQAFCHKDQEGSLIQLPTS